MNKPEKQIVVWGLVWLVVTTGVFFYAFNYFDGRTSSVQAELDVAKTDLSKLKAEELAVKLAKQDLENVKNKQIQPTDFFKKDITLVDQVAQLELLAKKYNLEMQPLGLSGTINSGFPVTGMDSIVRIPFGIQVVGSLENVEKFIESFENMSYILYQNNLNITSASDKKVNAQMIASFFIKK